MSKSTKKKFFIVELPLVVIPANERIIKIRFDYARRIYNAVLNDALKILTHMRNSEAYKEACLLPKGKQRTESFRDCNLQFGFNEFNLNKIAIKHKNNAKFNKQLAAPIAQSMANRVWLAVSQYAYSKKGKPRFKSRFRGLDSVQGKSNITAIRWKPGLSVVEWKGLSLPVKVPDTNYHHKALSSDTKYCRIIHRKVNKKLRWYVQLIQVGVPPVRYQINTSKKPVGLDVGPSTIAIVSHDQVGIEQFCGNVQQPWRYIKKIQRKMDRSRRVSNPENYTEDKTVKSGRLIWIKSNRYRKLQLQLIETERRLSETRKRDHGHLSNKIISIGTEIHTETLSYKAFQKMYGRSVKVRAPSMFMDLLQRKAENAGGKVISLNTWKLKMSQYDHVSDSFKKKPLSQRYQSVGNSAVQRDIYSAFLALHANEDAVSHNPIHLKERWTTSEPMLRQVGLCVNQSTNGKPPCFPMVKLPSELIACQEVR